MEMINIMSYTFDYMDDEQLDAFPLLKDGVYNFEVLKSTRKVSKSGNPMAEIQVKIWDNDTGKTNTIYDYLVFSNVPFCRRKVKHFCDSVGLDTEYKNCSLPEDLSRLCGKLELGTKDEEPNPTGGYYPKRNFVIDYVMTDKGAVKVPLTKPTSAPIDDDIPF